MATPKQAVLMIHGIGNQQPMQTLRSFVKAVWTDHTEIHNQHAGTGVWSKPDQVSRSFELRRLTTPENKGGIRTDFFEFYWAHLMHGTGYGHLVGWASSLLFRSPRSVPAGLKGAYWVLWALLLLILGVWVAYLAWSATGYRPPPADRSPLFWTVATTLIALVVLPLLGYVLKDIVGDAARYLRPSAGNIQRRNEIRSEGVKLLKALHARGYERIIVVGHSLGSVVGYDVLTYAFPEYNVPANANQTLDRARQALEKLAQDASEGKVASIVDLQEAQRAYFEELKAIGGQWRVTDFITLGSPLAHSEILLATDADDLSQKVALREYPRCLPALEQQIRTTDAANRRFTFGPYPDQTNGQRVAIPHHGAVFAPTRWTNLYFPARMMLHGDLIGGPIPPALGEAIRNVKVATEHHRGMMAHTHYWRQTGWAGDNNDDRCEAVKALRDALDLPDVRAKPRSERSGQAPQK